MQPNTAHECARRLGPTWCRIVRLIFNPESPNLKRSSILACVIAMRDMTSLFSSGRQLSQFKIRPKLNYTKVKRVKEVAQFAKALGEWQVLTPVTFHVSHLRGCGACLLSVVVLHSPYERKPATNLSSPKGDGCFGWPTCVLVGIWTVDPTIVLDVTPSVRPIRLHKSLKWRSLGYYTNKVYSKLITLILPSTENVLLKLVQ